MSLSQQYEFNFITSFFQIWNFTLNSQVPVSSSSAHIIKQKSYIPEVANEKSQGLNRTLEYQRDYITQMQINSTYLGSQRFDHFFGCFAFSCLFSSNCYCFLQLFSCPFQLSFLKLGFVSKIFHLRERLWGITLK